MFLGLIISYIGRDKITGLNPLEKREKKAHNFSLNMTKII
jgi:hypothetical protein